MKTGQGGAAVSNMPPSFTNVCAEGEALTVPGGSQRAYNNAREGVIGKRLPWAIRQTVCREARRSGSGGRIDDWGGGH